MNLDSEIWVQSLFQKEDFSGNTVIAAVSGGSDSLALLFLLKDYLERHQKHVRLIVVTVDHQLRLESKLEAEQVGEICKYHHIEHMIMNWDGEKPSSQISQEARFARYNLLCQVAERYGNAAIMTGHTLDDQAETYEMRLKRESHRGLAAMPRLGLLQGKIKLIRPLLSCRRQQLRNYLKDKNITWIDDPSNENTAYERVQIRQEMTDKKIENAWLNIQKARKIRQTQADAVAYLIDDIDLKLDKDFLAFSPLSADILMNKHLGFTLGVFAAIMGGASYLPSQKKIEKLQEFSKFPNDDFNRMTLTGSIVEKGKHQWRIWRESRNIKTIKVAAFKKALWDGRFIIENNSNLDITIEPATMSLLKIYEKNETLGQEKLHYASLAASPIVRQNQNVDIPIVKGYMKNIQNVTLSRIMSPFAWMISGDDFTMIDKLRPVFHQKYLFNEKN